jgi:hypothetical protein
MLSSVSDPDLYWNRIKSGQWIRIRIGTGFNQISGSGSVFEIRNGQNIKKISCFEVLDVLFVRAEGFFCNLDVLLMVA